MARKATGKTVAKPVEKTAEAAVKVEAPKTSSVKAEDKATTPEKPVKAEEKTAESAVTKKEAVKKAPAKKATAKKETVKKETVKKGTAKKELKTELYVQFADQSLTQDDLVKIAKDVWKYDLNQKVGDLKSIELYVKPEERKAYYVMNKDFTGSFGI